MRLHLPTYQYLLWLPFVALQGVIVVQMLIRRIHNEFPIFFTYSILHVLRSLVLLGVVALSTLKVYFVIYWGSEVLDLALTLALISELYTHVFRRYQALQDLGALLFRWCSVVVIFVAVMAASAAKGNDVSRLVQGIQVLDQTSAVITGGLICFLFLFASYFRLTWKQYVFGAAVGLGLYSSVELAGIVARQHFGASANEVWGVVKSAAYSCSILTWMFYFFSKEPAVSAGGNFPKHELENWNQALLELLHR